MKKLVCFKGDRVTSYVPGGSLTPEKRAKVIADLRAAAGGASSLAQVAKNNSLAIPLLSKMARVEGLRFPAGRRHKRSANA